MTPQRTCIACGSKAPRDDLLRVVLDPEGRPAIDFSSSLPGRGAWMCWRRECLEGSRKGLGRAFRQAMPADLDDGWAVEPVRRQLQRRLVEVCALLQRSGALKSGAHTVEMAIARGWARRALLASDAGADSAEKVRRACQRRDIPVLVLPLSAEELGQAVGKVLRSVAVTSDGTLVRELERTLQRSRGLL